MSDERERKPWDRLEGEPDEAFHAFQRYVGMIPDERKIAMVAPRATATLSRWYREYRWEARCVAWDKEFGSIRHEERKRILQRKAQEVAIDHMLILSDARELLQREFAKLLEASRDSEMHGLIQPRDLIRLADVAVKLDRLVRGETTENVGKTDLDLSKLSLDELEELDALMAKAGMKKAGA